MQSFWFQALIRAPCMCTGSRRTVLHLFMLALGWCYCCCYGDERQCSCLSAGETCHGEAAWVSCSELFWLLRGSVHLPRCLILAFHHGDAGIAAHSLLFLCLPVIPASFVNSSSHHLLCSNVMSLPSLSMSPPPHFLPP